MADIQPVPESPAAHPAGTTPAQPLPRAPSLAMMASEALEKLILEGELPAGSRINEQALAQRLGISRGPLREAVRGLERTGLLIGVPNQGSYVRRVSDAEAVEIYELRVVLSGHVCARLAERATPLQVEALRALVKKMAEAQTADDAARYYRANLDFHATLVSAGGGNRVSRLYEELGNELQLCRQRSLVAAEHMGGSNAEHVAILNAIAAGDVEAARAAGEAHIRGGLRRFLASMPAEPVAPEPEAAALDKPDATSPLLSKNR